MNTRALLIALLALGLGLVAVLVLARRSQRVLIDGLPLRIECKSQAEALALAGDGAIPVAGTGSMAPYIPASAPGLDPLATVVAYAVPGAGSVYKDIAPGALVVYAIQYRKGYNTMHQAALLDGGGWIMTGLHNEGYENKVRVTKENFVAVVARVYVWPQ